MNKAFSKSQCAHFGCVTEAYSRGLCKNHYNYHHHHGTLETVGLPPTKRGRQPMIVSAPVVIEPPTPVLGCEYNPVPRGKCAYQHLLGKVSDTLIAEVYGIDQGSVSEMRRRLKIPAMDLAEATWVTRGFKNFLVSQGIK